ncbi:MAG TPA: hypothetical protein VNA57_05760 [Acidimicrobiales bacterium]|nr:hypothetical protein [Acidimicrobiales bacterium]
MLYEEHVVDAVARFLVANGWSEMSRVPFTRCHGDDLVMAKASRRLLIEAKGATSSDPRSKRFDSQFNASQVGTHVGQAVLRALRWVSLGDANAAIALPDDRLHRLKVGEVALAIRRAGIGVFWVDDDRSVVADCPWDI